MSSKRNRKQLKPTIKEPASKKQKLDNETLEMKTVTQVSVELHTQLGHSQQSFDANELKNIIYFSNQLSERWKNNNNNICTITSNDLCCSIDEVKALVFYKKYNKINVRYPCNRLIYFCNASNYFAEKVCVRVFYTYFEECIPAIKYQHLTHLKSLCSTNQCKALLTAINVIKTKIQDKKKKMNNKIIENWKTVPLQLLLSNPDVSATVFIDNFKIDLWGRFDFERLRKNGSSDLVQLWKNIVNSKVYLSHPKTIDTVYGFADTTHINCPLSSNDLCIAVTNIVTDTMRICVENNLKSKHQNYLMICNTFRKMPTDKEIGAKPKKKYFNYDYFFDILKQLVTLRQSFRVKFPIYFGHDIIIRMFECQFTAIAGIAKWRSFAIDMQSLKVHEEFTREEKYQLLKSILDNYTKMGLKEELQDFIKLLIENDYEQTFKLTKLWFPILMKDHKNWIINELPQKTSLKILRILFDGMSDYVVSEECEKQGCDTDYFEFINQYTNVQWNVNT